MGDTLVVNALYRGFYQSLDNLLPESLDWLAYFLSGFALIFMLINSIMLLAMVYIYMERRVLGKFQSRLGPNRAGPFGLLQPVADAIKIMFKEDIVPENADRTIFNIAPVIMFIPVPLVIAVLPIGENFFLADLNVALLYVLAVTSLSTLAIFMAGWASSNRYAMFGAMRAVAQLISYEIPVVISLGSILLLSGSLSLVAVLPSPWHGLHSKRLHRFGNVTNSLAIGTACVRLGRRKEWIFRSSIIPRPSVYSPEAHGVAWCTKDWAKAHWMRIWKDSLAGASLVFASAPYGHTAQAQAAN